MVGIVIVSHSEALAKAVVDLAHLMAADVVMRPAGGLEDGSFGTSYDRIEEAIRDIYTEDGVIVIMDMGSSVMTTELVLEDMEDMNVKMADCPIVEGAIAAAVSAGAGSDLQTIIKELEEEDYRKGV